MLKICRFANMKILLSLLLLIVYLPDLYSYNVGSDSLLQNKTFKNEIQIKHDNDLYLMIMQDQYYTNGLHIHYRWGNNNIHQIYASHKMYNPFTAQVDSIEHIDRPFAAEFLVGYKLQKPLKENQFLRYGVEIGLMGEAAGGRLFQENLHSLLNMYHPDGWQYQLKNSVGVDLNLDYGLSMFSVKNNFEGIILGSLVAGTHHINSSASALFRLGLFNSINTSSLFHSRILGDATSQKRELYLYNSTSARWVGYDVTLQGGRFNSYKGPVVSEPIPLQFSNEIGFVYSNRKIDFSISYIFKTKEAEKSLFRHQYGSTSLSFRF